MIVKCFFRKCLLFFVLLLNICILIAQTSEENYPEPLLLNGSNDIHLNDFTSYFIDNKNRNNIDEIYLELTNNKFQNWKGKSTLNLGYLKSPLYIHARFTSNSSDKMKYWWSIYSQADSIFVFEKNDKDQFKCIDTLSSLEPFPKRKTRVRFMASELNFEPNETKELFLKIINTKTAHNFITDITTPTDNLFWEKSFYWSLGLIFGCLVFVLITSMALAFFLRENTFFIYSLYIVIVMIIILKMELLISEVFSENLFNFMKKLDTFSLSIVALGLYFKFLFYIKKFTYSNSKVTFFLKRSSALCLFIGLVLLFYEFIFYEKISTANFSFPVIHFSKIALIFLLFITIFCVIVLGNKRNFIFVIIGLLLVYFNPATYFLNYEGIIDMYKISYPNYFYWILCLEFIVFVCLLSWRYKKKHSENEILINQQKLLESKKYAQELEIQLKERNEIASDLHDDLGATLSALKLIISNKYKNDFELINIVTKANNGLINFYNELITADLQNLGLFESLTEKIAYLNNLKTILFTLITVGEEENIPKNYLLPIYKISSELLNNIVKHSKGKKCVFQLIVNDLDILLVCEDDGIGFDENKNHNGMGLKNIKNRVSKLSGDIHFSSNPNGTTYIITILK